MSMLQQDVVPLIDYIYIGRCDFSRGTLILTSIDLPENLCST